MKVISIEDLKEYILTHGFNKAGKIQPSSLLEYLTTIQHYLPHMQSKGISELAYCITHDIQTTPTCKCCAAPTSFISFSRGYRIYCGKKCESKDTDKIEKMKNSVKQTCLQKYGTNAYTQTAEFKVKTRNTCLKKYGNVNYGASMDCQLKTKKQNRIDMEIAIIPILIK